MKEPREAKMKRTKTILLDTAKFNRIRNLEVHGLNVPGALSPYDVPKEATIAYDDLTKDFTINLKYLTEDEPIKELRAATDMLLYLGKGSGKLYRVVIKGQDAATLHDVRHRLAASVEDLAEKSRKSRPSSLVEFLNLETTKQLLEETPEVYAVA